MIPLRRQVLREIERLADALRATGRIERYDAYWCDYDDRVIARFWLHDGGTRSHSITSHELAMGGTRDLDHWLRRVEIDIRSINEQTARARARREFAADRAVNPPILLDSNPETIDGYARAMMRYGVSAMAPHQWFAFDLARPTRDPKAEQKAKDLFRAVAGQSAYESLESGSLPITGSNGTKYVLHRRATFCIERPSDGAQLCVVVPGVPLWDHLLGVKLMVEHDEPKFLKTANVAGGALTADAVRRAREGMRDMIPPEAIRRMLLDAGMPERWLQSPPAMTATEVRARQQGASEAMRLMANELVRGRDVR